MKKYEKQIRQMRWSFSRLHTFEGCKYEWYLNYLLRDDCGNRIYDNEQNFYAAFGKFCHGILEQILNNKITIAQGQDYYSSHYYTETNVYDADPDIVDKYYYLGMSYFDNLDFAWLSDYEILGVEKEVVFRINDIEFVGYIDLLVRNKENGKIIVIDHKSSAYPLGKSGNVLKNSKDSYESYKKQLYMYSKAVYEEYGEYPAEIWWNYFKVQNWLKLPFVESEYKETLKWATNIVDKAAEEEKFDALITYFYCNNLCGFRNQCEYKMMEE